MTSPELIDQLKKLWVLDLVVRHGGFQKAALEAKVTRSAISQTISGLERLHGRNLLVRERGAIRPTEFCASILQKARPLWGALEDIRPLTARPEVPRMSWLDIGAYESLAVEIMPRLLGRLRAQCPGVRLAVRVSRSAVLARMVRKGELCMAIVVEPEQKGGLSILPLADDRLGLYLSAAVATNAGAATELPLGILSPGPDGPPRYLKTFLSSAAARRPASFLSDSFEALLEAAVQGAIVAVLPSRVAARRKGALTEVTPTDVVKKFGGRHHICLISRQNCDAKENEFLAQEIRSLLKVRPSH